MYCSNLNSKFESNFKIIRIRSCSLSLISAFCISDCQCSGLKPYFLAVRPSCLCQPSHQSLLHSSHPVPLMKLSQYVLVVWRYHLICLLEEQKAKSRFCLLLTGLCSALKCASAGPFLSEQHVHLPHKGCPGLTAGTSPLVSQLLPHLLCHLSK